MRVGSILSAPQTRRPVEDTLATPLNTACVNLIPTDTVADKPLSHRLVDVARPAAYTATPAGVLPFVVQP